MWSQSSASPRPTCARSHSSFSLGEEDDKDDEEDDEDEKDLDHQPAVGGDRLEVFEDLCVGRLHVQLRVLHICINPARENGRADQISDTRGF